MDTTGRDDSDSDRRHDVGRSGPQERGRRARRDPHAVVCNAREAPAIGDRGASPVTESAAPSTTAAPKRSAKMLGRVIFLAITAACFLFLYYRLNGAAAREGLPLT